MLDDNLLSAPNILQPIRKEGRITGRFTRAEVEQLGADFEGRPVASGADETADRREPDRRDAGCRHDSKRCLGDQRLADARCWCSSCSITASSGIIACIALVMNLAMILATMVLINQPLTLPGLAGLVLTVGMSVDANVLIFERIREELKKGAAARMAIRNGFSKATVTIIDANLTT